MNINAMLDSMNIWIFRNYNLREDLVEMIFNNFFMGGITTDEKQIWKLYRKSNEKEWHRNGRLATKIEVELGVSDLECTDIWGDLPKYIFTWLIICTGKCIDRVSEDELANMITNLCENSTAFKEKMVTLKRFNGVQYTEFEPDEKDKDIPIETVLNYIVYNYKKELHGNNKEYRRAFSIAYKIISVENSKIRLSRLNEMGIHEKVICRRVYEEMVTHCNKIDTDSCNEELKKKCEYLLSIRGKNLGECEFVYKVIDTVKGRGYKYNCSEKQSAIIDEAIAKANKNTSKQDKHNKDKEDIKELIANEGNTYDSGIESIDLNDVFL